MSDDLDFLIQRDARKKYLLQVRQKILLAKDDLITFAQYMRPDPKHLGDPTKSVYEVAPHHAFVADRLMALERGDITRLILSVPPRHGKSELASKTFVPWAIGRNPYWSTIMATYNSTFAGDFGRSVRNTLQDPRYHQVFPGTLLDPQSKAIDRMNTQTGAQMTFVGRGGSLTGRGGHLLVVDDPLKDRKEADSGLVRDQLWSWWTQVFTSRAMQDDVRILLIQTRWHEDDLIGRLTDPHNPSFNSREAARWEVINLPALAGEHDPLGRSKGEPLWPTRFSTTYLAGLRDQDSRGFSALYQGEPSPDTGLFFGPEDIIEYQKMDQVPKDLRYYAASDHAISTQQWADKTVLMVFGVDENDDVWIMPDTNVNKHPSNLQVEIMIALIKKYKPLFWFAERGHITKSIGPFLRKRMQEEKVFTSVYELTPTNDKQTRAQSVKGRMATGKIHFPAWAAWYPSARREILTFPAGAKDDFVDTLSMVGLGLSLQTRARSVKSTGPLKRGTLGYIKKQTQDRERKATLAKQKDGW
jgi:predicted phage terminase large subunit-like protein